MCMLRLLLLLASRATSSDLNLDGQFHRGLKELVKENTFCKLDYFLTSYIKRTSLVCSHEVVILV